MTIAGVLRWDLRGPISCQAANKLQSKTSAPFNLTVFCKCCSHTPVTWLRPAGLCTTSVNPQQRIQKQQVGLSEGPAHLLASSC